MWFKVFTSLLINQTIMHTSPWHDDVMKWRHFPRYWPFVRGIHRSPVNSPHSQRPVTRTFDVFFDLSLNKHLTKHSRHWWFETPSHPLWRHFNEMDKKACVTLMYSGVSKPVIPLKLNIYVIVIQFDKSCIVFYCDRRGKCVGLSDSFMP